jgi:hypothetical protein
MKVYIFLSLLAVIGFALAAPMQVQELEQNPVSQSGQEMLRQGITTIVEGSTNIKEDRGVKLAKGILDTIFGSLQLG